MSGKTTESAVRWAVSLPIDNRSLRKTVAVATRLKRVAVYTQLDVAGMGVAGALTAMIVLSLPPSPAPLVVGLVAYGVYVGDRISDIKREPTATADRAMFFNRHERVLSISSAVAYGLAIGISVFGGPLALAITLIPGVSWVVYASDWIEFDEGPMDRLKTIFIVNSSIVAFAWAVTMVLLPVAFAKSGFSLIALVLVIYFFVDIFINTEIPNVRDVADDEKNGVATFPTVLGITRTRHALYALNGVLILFIVGTAFGTTIPAVIATALLAGRGVSILLNYFVGRIDDHRLLEMAGEMNHVFVAIILLGLIDL